MARHVSHRDVCAGFQCQLAFNHIIETVPLVWRLASSTGNSSTTVSNPTFKSKAARRKNSKSSKSSAYSEYGAVSVGANVRLRFVAEVRSASCPLMASGTCQLTMWNP